MDLSSTTLPSSGSLSEGDIRFNQNILTNFNSLSQVAISESEADNPQTTNGLLTGVLNIIEQVNNPSKAFVILSKQGDPSSFISFFISTVLEGEGAGLNYRKYTVTPVEFSGTFTDNEVVFINFSLVGAQGVQGTQGVQGVQGSQGAQGAQGNQGGNSETAIIVALSDEISNVGIGTSVVTFRMPFKCNIPENPRIQVSRKADPGFGTVEVDILYKCGNINDPVGLGNPQIGAGWTSFFTPETNRCQIVEGAYSGIGTLSGSILNDVINSDDLIRFDINGIGTGARGLKGIIYYSRLEADPFSYPLP